MIGPILAQNGWVDLGPTYFLSVFLGGPDPNGSAQAHMVAGPTQQPCKVIMLQQWRGRAT